MCKRENASPDITPMSYPKRIDDVDTMVTHITRKQLSGTSEEGESLSGENVSEREREKEVEKGSVQMG